MSNYTPHAVSKIRSNRAARHAAWAAWNMETGGPRLDARIEEAAR